MQRLQHDLVMCNSFLDCCDRAQRWDLALHILTRRFDIHDQRAQRWDVAWRGSWHPKALISFGIVKICEIVALVLGMGQRQ